MKDNKRLLDDLDLEMIIEVMRKQGFKIEYPEGKKHLDNKDNFNKKGF